MPGKKIKNMEKRMETAIRAAIDAGKAILEIYQTDFDIEYKSDQSPLTTADNESHRIISAYLKETGLPILSEEGKQLPYEERKHWQQFWMVDPLDGTKEFIKKNGEFTVNIALIEGQKTVTGVIYVPVTDVLYVGLSSDGAFMLNSTENFNGTIRQLKEKAVRLPERDKTEIYTVVASRSHLNDETKAFLEELKKTHRNIDIVSKGSSLKLCLIAEGKADIYPRFAPTSEWDIAAGHAIVNAAGGTVTLAEDKATELKYNKENILNPWFVAKRK
jgi:3'(2'), 5'-bisphosphate nucleotidase